MTNVLQHSDLKKPPEITLLHSDTANLHCPSYTHFHDIDGLKKFSEADILTLLSIQSSLSTSQISKDEAALFLLHTAALWFLPLRYRYLPTFSSTDGYQRTVSLFTQSALSILSSSVFINQLNSSPVICNLVDLIDGRLLAKIMADHVFRSTLLLQENIKRKFDSLCAALGGICRVSISIKVEQHASTESGIRASAMLSNDCAILSFKNSVFERHLDPIHLNTVDDSRALTFSQTQIFRELSYWRRQEKVPVNKGSSVQVERQADKMALTQNQNFQKEIQVYAASLTNASGKVLEPQIIVAGSASHHQKLGVRKPAKQQEYANEPPKRNKQPGNPNKKGGKIAALEAAAEIKAITMKPKSEIKANFWRAKCKEILAEDDLTIRRKLGLQYLQSLDKFDHLGPEVQLFTVDCLFQILIKGKTAIDKMNIAALAWDTLHRLSKATVGVTPEVAMALKGIIISLGFPGIEIKTNAPSRPLAFPCVDPRTLKRDQFSLPGSPIEFQLEHCGPYLDRALDSASDSRVPFEPDGWQRCVLDAIDKNQSLFITAPTSAGKTFISFYAMEKVLKADDDGVLAYVAPTTALVNQIAAEIHGRFSKNYKHAGRSVWAIYTRDYRINNPTGCQILVTVPHMLQSLLLTPMHAGKNNSWSTRIKRIIFDEIHSIGQGKDGVIWEQLLLQAPCPIIALSATVGNPRELSDWLSLTEMANANELVTIQHHHRYSNLRSFVYVPPKVFCFSGLPALPGIYTPGLDGSNAFAFVHPVASLINREKGMPNDLSLEARDCLRLWQIMSRYATEKHSLPQSLHPEKILPLLVKKINVINWEAELKEVLQQWMVDDSSPFDLVSRDLGSNLQHMVARDDMNTKHSCGKDCDHREVDTDSLSSTVLPVLVDLHAKDALPCLVFNYDRIMCETLAHFTIDELCSKENAWKASKSSWQKKIADFDQYQKELEIARARAAKAPRKEPKKKKRGEDEDDDAKVSKAERAREQANADVSVWAGFNPDAPIDGFHFADITKLAMSELAEIQSELRVCRVPEWLVHGLERGVGVHHSGMHRRYLQIVEVLFRRGFLRVVLATGTLALGINMPCKTVVFAGDSMSLTALNFRQAAGRAGRRGFDLLGNVVFVGIQMAKVFRLLSSRLTDLTTQYPISTSLILRLAVLLHGSNNSLFAVQTINLIFSRPHLYLGLPESGTTVRHHLRFSIEYLRRQLLLDTNGAPINFASFISPLSYTGNSVWAFHALLSKGYFHTLCKDIEINPERVLATLMLVLSHIFERQSCKRSDIEFIDDNIKRSSSVVFLPPLPKAAMDALSTHNAETLSVFKAYAKTYINQYLHYEDNKLPLTKYNIGSEVVLDIPASACGPPPLVRSAFVALSGHGDEFSTISELCNTVRSGVFLEEAIMPYLPIYREESDPPLNAYLLDFFKHGDIRTIEHANKIQASEIWSRLKGMLDLCRIHIRYYDTNILQEFSTILHTIVGCLTDLTKSVPLFNTDNLGIQSERDSPKAQRNEKAFVKQAETDTGKYTQDTSVYCTANAKNTNVNDDNEEDWHQNGMNDKNLLRVLRAFVKLRGEFEVKLRKIAD